MAKILGLTKLLASLRGRAREAAEQANVSVIVGYTQSYAIYVHENLEAYHKVGQAKFLEQPARELGSLMGSIVRNTVRRGKPIAVGLFLAGLRLQRESQKLCPVDTGALKGSAFTRLEK